MKIKAINVRKGNVIEYRNELYRVTEFVHVTPGKGPAFIQLKMKRLSDGVNAENRFRPDESMEKATLQTREHQFLYNDGDIYYFMDMETYEQIHITNSLLGDDIYYLLPETMVQILFHGTTPVGVELPGVVELKVIETEPSLKGATVSSSYKPAKLETGLNTQIPPFISEGEVVRIDTATGKYIERAK
ncbi:elongation factor P [candidate division KSB1 bacterium 4484_188]|nr:MAG: elongation factor P [candidate division KSB1 bacterium 4484_188]